MDKTIPWVARGRFQEKQNQGFMIRFIQHNKKGNTITIFRNITKTHTIFEKLISQLYVSDHRQAVLCFFISHICIFCIYRFKNRGEG